MAIVVHSQLLSQIVMQSSDRLDQVLVESESSLVTAQDKYGSSKADEKSDDWGARGIDLCCMRHIAAAQRRTKGERYCSIALDKADIRSSQMQNGAVVLPSNVGFALVPQVGNPLQTGLFYKGLFYKQVPSVAKTPSNK